jgi:hypothetical protein
MTIFNSRRFKTQYDVTENKDVWVYGTLKDKNLQDQYPLSIVISKNKVYTYDPNLPRNDFGYFQNLKNNYTGTKIVKFLDRNGKYRVYNFNCKWEQSSSVTERGIINKSIVNLLASQGDKSSLGKDKVTTISLTAKGLDQEMYDKLSDIYDSPKVFMYIGDGLSDVTKDWIEVISTTDSYTSRKRKSEFNEININIQLPSQYTITKI